MSDKYLILREKYQKLAGRWCSDATIGGKIWLSGGANAADLGNNR